MSKVVVFGASAAETWEPIYQEAVTLGKNSLHRVMKFEWGILRSHGEPLAVEHLLKEASSSVSLQKHLALDPVKILG